MKPLVLLLNEEVGLVDRGEAKINVAVMDVDPYLKMIVHFGMS